MENQEPTQRKVDSKPQNAPTWSLSRVRPTSLNSRQIAHTLYMIIAKFNHEQTFS